jgi:hypothetical protein
VQLTGSAEFRLAVECCGRSFRETTKAGPITVPREIDWHRFLRIVEFHRIEGLAWNCLSNESGLPPHARSALSAAASRIAADSLRAIAESRDLNRSFETAGIPVLFLKGITLGRLAYDNPALKSAVDIDLLIDRRDLGEVAKVLRQAGYESAAPAAAMTDEALRRWHDRRKESVWTGTLQIDLHTRLADSNSLISDIGVHSHSAMIAVADGIRLPTLDTDELFAYLALHGASSAWFRLKWISDLAGFVRGAGRVDQLYRRSQQLGAGRSAGQALLLADELFGTLGQCTPLRDELFCDPKTVLLFRAALRQLTGDPVEPTEQRFGTWTIHWTQYFLLPGLTYKASELAQQVSRTLNRFRS